MTLTKIHTFGEGAPPGAFTVGGDYLQVSGTNTYSTIARHGSVAHRALNGGYVTLPTPSDVFTVSSYVRALSLTAGAARVQTATDSANTFVGMVRMHFSGLFDICDNTSTRQAASAVNWEIGPWYRIDTQFGGAGTARTVWSKVHVADSMNPIWDSGAVPVVAGSANPVTRLRIGAQGNTAGEVITDSVRFYDGLEWPRPPFAQFGIPL